MITNTMMIINSSNYSLFQEDMSPLKVTLLCENETFYSCVVK